MRPLNLRVVLLLGGILLVTLAFQIFQRYTVERFIDIAMMENFAVATTPNVTTPPATTSMPATTPATPAVTLPALTTPVEGTTGGSSGTTYYTIPVGNNQFIKLEIPVQPATGVMVPEGPVPVSTTPPIK